MNRAIVLATFSLLSGCLGSGEPDPGFKQLEIDHYRTPCTGWEGQLLCLRAREPGADEWSPFYDPIVGFEFLWGVRSTITVREEPVAEPLEDAPAVRTILDEVRETAAVEPGTEFVVAVDGSQRALGVGEPLTVSGEGGAFADGRPFGCASAATCAAIEAVFAEGRRATVRFAYADPIEAPLVAVAVE